MKCAACGNTEKFRRIYDATVTTYVNGEGEEVDESKRDVNMMDDDYQEECEECGSYLLVTVD